MASLNSATCPKYYQCSVIKSHDAPKVRHSSCSLEMRDMLFCSLTHTMNVVVLVIVYLERAQEGSATFSLTFRKCMQLTCWLPII
jgi:hypothetical protein